MWTQQRYNQKRECKKRKQCKTLCYIISFIHWSRQSSKKFLFSSWGRQYSRFISITFTHLLVVVDLFRVYPSGFLHISHPYINSLLAVSKVITFPVTFSKFKSNFPLGLFPWIFPCCPIYSSCLPRFPCFGIIFQ